MPVIRVAFDQFPLSPAPLVTEDVAISWPDMIWAAVTVGRRTWADVMAHSVYSYFEAIYRICILRANLRTQAGGFFARSSAYNNLDPSEKGAVSYFIGLTLGKFLCEQVLDAPWMMHLDVYRTRLFPSIIHPGGKPDLVGEDLQRRWIVCEAKGRTGRFDLEGLRRAKEQTTYISRIAGQVPFLRVAMLSYFSKRRLSAYFVDPDEVSQRPSRLMISHSRLIRDYYEPIVSIVKGARLRSQTNELVTHLREVDVLIGINKNIHDLVLRGEFDAVVSHATEIPASTGSEKRRLGKDGVSVELGPTWFSRLRV